MHDADRQISQLHDMQVGDPTREPIVLDDTIVRQYLRMPIN